MGELQKASKAVYMPIEDDQSSNSATESDGLMSEGYHPPTGPRWKSSRKIRVLIACGGFLAFMAYSALLLSVPWMWLNKERSQDAEDITSPLKPYVKYEPTFFGNTETSKDYPLVGRPNEELDASWHSIMQYFYAEIPVEMMEKLGRTKQGIQLPNGNYLANFAFIHQLHCLKRLHQSYFPDRYFPNMTEEEQELQLEHNLHCLQMLVEAIMCKADEAPLTMFWFDESILPGGNRTIPHQCVNWKGLMNRMEKIKVDPFTPGLLVHPKYGPVVPDGRKTVFDNRIGYVKHATPLDRDKWP
ncbi:hypothetical protein F5X96DRAFT_645331 [Biscogniauxia mediterranea]|nr:hypothetical protein F5X96DRAFT_645331 [Biscogniauxia mediterranea]